MSTNHLIWYTVMLGTSTCSQLKVSLPSKRKGLLLNYSVDNEMSALPRLSFYENLLIGQEISVGRPYFFEKMYGLSSKTK